MQTFYGSYKVAENIGAEVVEILISAGLQPDLVPVITHKASNIVAATSHKVRIDCVCHRLHTAIESVWEKAKAAHSTLKELYESCHKLVQYVKKTTGIQSQLPITLKQGGTTRPWRVLIKMMHSIKINIEDENTTLASHLRSRKKEGLLSDIDQRMLNFVYNFLQIAEPIFDVLEFSTIPSLGNVLPSYYLLRTTWNEKKVMDICEVRRLKKELVDAIDAKLWTSIVQLHFAATFLDPSLKAFRFCDVKKDKVLFRQ